MSTVSKIRQALAPFLYRALRGGRRMRTAVFAAVLSAFAIAGGLWIAYGEHAFEREMREALDLEVPSWQREHETFVKMALSDGAARRLLRARDRTIEILYESAGDTGAAPEVHELLYAVSDGIRTLEEAATTPIPQRLSPSERRRRSALAQQASELAARLRPRLVELGLRNAEFEAGYGAFFDWKSEAEIHRLERILAQQGVPGIVRYRVETTPRQAVGLVGFCAGFVLFVVGAILAPFVAGSAIAGEVHAGTLAPLLCTGLSVRQVIAGLFSGATVRLALAAAPLLLVFAAAGLVVTGVAATLFAIAVLVGGTLAFCAIAMAVGYGLGRRWIPAVTSGLLMLGLVPVAMFGWFAGLFTHEGIESATPFLGLVPQLAMAHVVRTTTLPVDPTPLVSGCSDCARFDPAGPILAVVVGLGMLATYAALSLRGLERRLGGTAAAMLTRVEAAVGTTVAVAGAHVAIALAPKLAVPDAFSAADPDAGRVIPLLVFFSALPAMTLLAAARAAVFSPRRGPLRTVGPEVLATVAGALALAVLLSPASTLTAFTAEEIVSVLGRALWVGGVFGLAGAMLAARPPGLAGAVGTVLALLVAFGTGIEALLIAETGADHVSNVFFPVAEASPMLAVLEALFLVAIPVAFAWRLRARPGPLDIDDDDDD